MVKKLIRSYVTLLDEKLENWTLIVLLISVLVVLVSILINNISGKPNINYIDNTSIEINWKIFELKK